MLIWPAVLNGYPIVFADTGTYLSQAMHRYLGWDRPVFYSLSIWPLHMGLTLWPVIGAQAGLAVFVLNLTRRGFGLPLPWLPVPVAFLASATWFPWTVSEVMPDFLTPLLVLSLSLLLFAAPAFGRWERLAMTGLAAFAIAAQQSSVPLSLAILSVFGPAVWIARRRASGPTGTSRDMIAPFAAPVLAAAALLAVNALGHGRLSLSPYGNVFLLARVIYDGPGMTVLRRRCPAAGWRLCPYLDRFPAASDGFLWDRTSPIVLAGGHKAVSADADAIIRAAVAAEPGRMTWAVWHNTLEQLRRFDSGDGLEPWPDQVDIRIGQDFPAREAARYRAARQQRGLLSVPSGGLHWVMVVGGFVAAVGLLPVAWRRRHVSAWFLAAALFAQPVSAAITGGLSTPHDRYQSRIAWLPALIVFLTVPALRRR